MNIPFPTAKRQAPDSVNEKIRLYLSLSIRERMTGWIIYPRYVARHGDNAFEWLAAEAGSVGLWLEILFIEDITIGYCQNGTLLLHRGNPMKDMPAFVVMRTYDSVVSRFFESSGIPVINSTRSMELCKNKMLTHEMLSRADIPTPLTLYNESSCYDYNTVCEMFGSPRFIVKRIDGAKGEQVYLVESRTELDEAVERCGRRCICQKFAEESYGRDVRVWVIGGEVAGAVLRYSETSFLSNFSQGGKVEPFALPQHAAALAVRGAEAVGTEFAGVDLLFGTDGFLVNEINGNAGFRTLSKVGRNDIPHHLFRYIQERYINGESGG